MSVFVDTDVFYAHHDRDAPRHEVATEALELALAGRFGHVFTSDYVLDETVALTRSRTGSFDDTMAVAERILGRGKFPPVVELLFVGETTFDEALGVFETYRDHPLSFTDATTVALMEAHGIDALFSFDSDFDGIVERVDPGEVATESG